jgi:hypothetical protein
MSATTSRSRARTALAAASAVLGIAATISLASPATAAHKDGVCEASASVLAPGEMCLYFNSNQAGSIWDWRFAQGNVADFGALPQRFMTAGLPGYNDLVKNNAASAWNRFWGESVYVYYNSNFMGSSDFVGSQSKKQLVNTYNENASMRWTE